MEEIVPFDKLPLEIRNRLANYENPEESKWVFRRVPLDNLNFIASISPDDAADENEYKAIQRYKYEYLERRCYTPLILGKDLLYIIDGFHHLTAFRMAIDEDEALPNIIECWVQVN